MGATFECKEADKLIIPKNVINIYCKIENSLNLTSLNYFLFSIFHFHLIVYCICIQFCALFIIILYTISFYVFTEIISSIILQEILIIRRFKHYLSNMRNPIQIIKIKISI